MPTITQQQLKKMVDGQPEEIRSAIYTRLKQRGIEVVEKKEESSFLGSLVKEVAKPYGKLTSTLASAGRGIYKLGEAGVQYAQGDKEKALQTALSAGQPQKVLGYEPIKSAKEAIGTGIEIGADLIGLKVGAPKTLKSAVGLSGKFGATTGFARNLQEGGEFDPADLLFDTALGGILGSVTGAGVYGTTKVVSKTAKLAKEKLLKPGWELLKDIGKNFAATFSPATREAIDQVSANPAAARKFLEGNNLDLMTDLAKSAQAGVNKIQKEAGDSYKEIISSIPKQNIKNINKAGAVNAFNEAFEKVGLKINQKTKELEGLAKSSLSDLELSKIKRFYNTIKGWTNVSPSGLNDLTKKAQTFKGGKDYEVLNSTISSFNRNVRNFLADQLDDDSAIKAAKDYAERMSSLDAIRDTLKISGRFQTQTDILKTIQKLSTIFNANKQNIRQIISEELGGDVLTGAAVREMTTAPTKFAESQNIIEKIIEGLIPKDALTQVVIGLSEKSKVAENVISESLNSLINSKVSPAVVQSFIKIIESMKK